MADCGPFLAAVDSRRSIYGLNKTSPIPDDRIVELLHDVIQHVPSSFNSQSTRLVLLLKNEHDTFWDMVLEVLQPHITSDEQREKTKNRLGMFRKAYGSILFFEDPEPVYQNQTNFPMYAQHFPDWSEQTNGMHQFALWTALEAEGLGANLQHYNPIVDNRAKEHWKIPMSWRLRAQLVFGGKVDEAAPPAKPKNPVSETVFVHGK